MTKSLVIVESPAKAKTINRYLGDDYIVKSCVGHVRDLPTGKSNNRKEDQASSKSAEKLDPKQKLFARMGVYPEQDWGADYKVIPGKEKIVRELRSLAKQVDTVYLATDLDREGEAIAWHLKQLIEDGRAKSNDDDKFRRVVFNEITRQAVRQAFEQPGNVDMARVDAQQARRFLDRIVGFMLSPLLWSKVARGLSAGRVQSVAVRLIVEREYEIQDFITEEYWEVRADTLTETKAPLRLQVKKQAGKTFRPHSKEETDAALAELKLADYHVSSCVMKPTKLRPYPPLITSTLQQAASVRLGYGVRRTMGVAQRLYEAGFITYMRTDSTALSADAVKACRGYIKDQFGAEYLPDKQPFYASRAKAQEAHEAIRPTDVNRTADSPEIIALGPDQQRIYALIRNSFMASQMQPARFDSTRLTADAGAYQLVASGRVLRFDGFLRVLPQLKKFNPKDKDEQLLPPLQEGEKLQLQDLLPSQHFTKPPPRYTEASLVKELEKRSIGRPSTYANIISTIQERGYASIENKRFKAEKIGEIVNSRLVECFGDLLNYDFTANLENDLDRIAENQVGYKDVLNSFYQKFTGDLERAEDSEDGMRSNTPVLVPEVNCDKCGRPMGIRNASSGQFLFCQGYSLPAKEQCKNTANLLPHESEKATASELDEAAAETRELKQNRERFRCEKCNALMRPYIIDRKRCIHICSHNPDCAGYRIENGDFPISGYDGPELECDRCGAAMELKDGRFGKYFACSNEDCKNTRKLMANGQPAPPRMEPIPLPDIKCENAADHMVLREGSLGLFLSASTYPKVRESRPPLISELAPILATW